MTIIANLPRDFTLRSQTMEDIEAVVQFINYCEVANGGESDWTADHFRTAWQMPGFDQENDTWLVLSPEGQFVAVAEVTNRHYVQFRVVAYVHPDYQEHGIDSYLMQLVEQRAQQQLVQAAPETRVTLSARVSDKNRVLRRLLEQKSFAIVRHFWRMGIELNEVLPTAQWAEGITVRTLAPGMEHALYEADEEAFLDHWGFIPGTFEEWKQWVLERENFDPSLVFLAMDGDEIAGFAICQDEKEQGAWVHVLGVRRAWRRRGLGLALLHHAFAEFYQRGSHTVYLSVDAQSLTGATKLYTRAGMHVVQKYNMYEKELRAGKEISTQSVEG